MGKLSLDNKDLMILKILQKDAKVPIKVIARSIKSPMTTVYAKIKRMEKAGVITYYKAVIDGKSLGLGVVAFIFVNFRYGTQRKVETSEQRLAAEKIARFEQVQELYLITGDWDMLIKIRVGSIEEAASFVIDTLRKIEGIDKTHTVVVFDVNKETTDLPIRAPEL